MSNVMLRGFRPSKVVSNHACFGPTGHVVSSARRKSVVARHRQASGLAPLPLSYYELLQVTKDASSEDCRMAYDELVAFPVDPGYSTDCMYSRAQLLKVAADCLVDTDARSHYNQMLSRGDSQAQILYGDLPGALALLQETKHPDLVIKLAKQWLQDCPHEEGAADVALAMAQSYCDLANEALCTSDGRVTGGFEYLVRGADVLAAHSHGTRLAEDIAAALEDMALAYLTECLAEPLSDSAGIRRRSLQLLHRMLWTAETHVTLAVGSHEREALLQGLRPHLTAQEIMELYEHAPRSTPLPNSELYELALAHLAEGLRTRNPTLVEAAADGLRPLEHVMEVHAERAVCALLLGNADEALGVLNLSPGSPRAPDAEVLQFIHDYGDGDDEALSGVLVLAERWMQEVLVPDFREFPAGYVASLEQWGEEREVQAYFAAQERPSILRSIAAFFQRIWAAGSMLLAFLARAVGLHGVSHRLGHALPDELVGEEQLMTEGGLRELAAEERRMFTQPRLPLALLAKCVAALLPVAALAYALYKAAPQQAEIVVDLPQTASPAAAAQIVAKVAPAVDRVSSAELATSADLSSIKNALQSWQSVKQQAMGPSHDVAALDSVLEGSMLQQWRTRANHVKNIDWYWRYNNQKVTIKKADFIKSNTAKVEVTFHEKADAIFKGEVHDSYKNSYTIEYHLTRRDVGWKISGSRIVDSSTVKAQ